MKIGYCCNVHGGSTLDEVKSNLARFACEVKRQVSPDRSMPVGLWLSQNALAEIGGESSSCAVNEFADWLTDKGLDPFTINGFPQGNFHQEVVKRDVYRPTWATEERLQYTKTLASVHCALTEGYPCEDLLTISTLPLGWPTVAKSQLFSDGVDFLNQCADKLLSLVEFLARLRDDRGKHVMVCLEPEPGCVLDNGGDIVRFFEEYLLRGESAANETVLDHLGICHDVCHSAVMFEDQRAAVGAYSQAGIRIGKVQVSSAVKAIFDESDHTSRREQLASFSEARYLHQTSVRTSDQARFYEDLGDALRCEQHAEGAAEWRVHFHVPIFVESLGELSTTQAEISEFMAAIKEEELQIPHFEIETYAWNVLPQQHQSVAPDLASGIAEEIRWFESLVANAG